MDSSIRLISLFQYMNNHGLRRSASTLTFPGMAAIIAKYEEIPFINLYAMLIGLGASFGI